MKFKLLAVLTMLLAAPAVAQELPAEVAEAYTAYTQALEAGDSDTALEAAHAAWRAGESHDIDPETLGILADNYAELAYRSGNFAEARNAYERSAEILVQTNGGGSIIG